MQAFRPGLHMLKHVIEEDPETTYSLFKGSNLSMQRNGWDEEREKP